MPIPLPDLPIEPRVPEGMLVTFANYTYVQTMSGDMVVSFFQAVHPLIVENSEQPQSITAMCVGRLGLNLRAAEALVQNAADLLGFDLVKRESGRAR